MEKVTVTYSIKSSNFFQGKMKITCNSSNFVNTYTWCKLLLCLMTYDEYLFFASSNILPHPMYWFHRISLCGCPIIYLVSYCWTFR